MGVRYATLWTREAVRPAKVGVSIQILRGILLAAPNNKTLPQPTLLCSPLIAYFDCPAVMKRLGRRSSARACFISCLSTFYLYHFTIPFLWPEHMRWASYATMQSALGSRGVLCCPRYAFVPKCGGTKTQTSRDRTCHPRRTTSLTRPHAHTPHAPKRYRRSIKRPLARRYCVHDRDQEVAAILSRRIGSPHSVLLPSGSCSYISCLCLD